MLSDAAGRVRVIQVKRADPGSNRIWGAFRLSGRVLAALHGLWLERDRRDAYVGTLVNECIARGAPVHALRTGELYFDVGTLDGYRHAMQLLDARSRAGATSPPLDFTPQTRGATRPLAAGQSCLMRQL